ncbi:unnamed protein product [Paramecium primaurelia]|uniref:Uncharacterized protein n=1 Tax=Paramecium primaurelia TaxID=5886 RepID=A0A8S1MN36_PARPR|nr:unnamed protein product [Paramecium primaurelia]
MKSSSPKNQIIIEKRGLSEHIQATCINSGSRKPSIITKDGNILKGNLQSLQKQTEINNFQLKKVSSTGKLLIPKNDQSQQKQKRFSSKEGDGLNAIRSGYLYKQISPKVTMQEDKMNVVFIQELNKYQINNEPTSPKSPKLTDANLFMHEMSQNGFQMKGPQSPLSHDILTNGQLKNKIPKSVLSHHQNLIPTSGKKINEQKTSKQYQNTVTYF